ncbi:tRNA (adenosine(37)-N6)-dimethylallyltransferase MiaA [Thiomicrorhabdus sediminis]|uniref:tRNA dimethylallyltransferase n=1 Tax=Thiomicrorhabdus sediminis TaxID=2580412 RepID=A0A4P9K629_9GAMM|nr:tRNA (adenosine(37)-N6)-dimethylallyltransferase MiaA [Thiomicrorhabdus sediminis]QCU90318.1 tRNA (adenosine(37)-N6)-dimethylallyltransferase MiaA [Thiomicrorhabdus sediminis]
MNELLEQLIAQRKCLAIMGPTASGKTQLAMLLAKQLPVEIISVDSALIYRQMDIGTAKPSAAELVAVPHHLINTHDASESYSASEFVDDVKRLVDEIYQRNRLPLLVGGTMMYFNALQQGMSDLPSADESVREGLQRQWQENPQSLHQRLQQVDPESAERIHPNDPQRLIRAIEVYEVTGKSLTEFRRQPKKGLPDFTLLKVALIPEDRANLHKQIEKRFLAMLENGFLQEVKALYERGDLNADMTSIRSVGYRQAWSFIEAEYDYETFIHKGVVATRQLAKRQLTWLRKESGMLQIDPYQTTPEQRVEKTMALLERSIGE